MSDNTQKVNGELELELELESELENSFTIKEMLLIALYFLNKASLRSYMFE